MNIKKRTNGLRLLKGGPPMGRPEVVASFFQPSTHKELADAEVIMGKDEVTGNEFLVFGRESCTGNSCIEDISIGLRCKGSDSTIDRRTGNVVGGDGFRKRIP